MLILQIVLFNVFFFYLHGDNGSGILNVFETNKHLNTMQNHWVVQIRLHILAIPLLRTTAWFIQDHPVFLVGKRSKQGLRTSSHTSVSGPHSYPGGGLLSTGAALSSFNLLVELGLLLHIFLEYIWWELDQLFKAL